MILVSDLVLIDPRRELRKIPRRSLSSPTPGTDVSWKEEEEAGGVEKTCPTSARGTWNETTPVAERWSLMSSGTLRRSRKPRRICFMKELNWDMYKDPSFLFLLLLGWSESDSDEGDKDEESRCLPHLCLNLDPPEQTQPRLQELKPPHPGTETTSSRTCCRGTVSSCCWCCRSWHDSCWESTAIESRRGWETCCYIAGVTPDENQQQ